ncbi:hypothetical protein [Paenibacillus beijingensis]|uniref:Hydrolase n=1 Tax=Paenibacillus beijingensis TaxID=1126833 RepID=A0A0D5NK54_9BACL|nr:hypothetical protein [Paenibacillus beijingensis]AJY75392.1 hypothetical protein VN24_13475 [Paenibacillus beijingensis]
MDPLQQRQRLEKGATTLYASQFDQRFSYCAYVPKSFDAEHPQHGRLIVLIHGTDRNAQIYRDAFSDLAEQTGAMVLAPLFPAGIIEAGELNAYKFVRFHDIRFDHVLLSMIDEFSSKYGVAFERFLLFGFSGGAQFVHRFYYLHPQLLEGVSIASPGNVTLLDDTRDWFVGTRGFEEQFGSKLDLERLREVPVQLVIGSLDCEIQKTGKENPFWQEGVEVAGDSRLARIRTLRDNMIRNGIRVRYDEVEDAAHEGKKLFPVVQSFFGEILAEAGGWE